MTDVQNQVRVPLVRIWSKCWKRLIRHSSPNSADIYKRPWIPEQRGLKHTLSPERGLKHTFRKENGKTKYPKSRLDERGNHVGIWVTNSVEVKADSADTCVTSGAGRGWSEGATTGSEAPGFRLPHPSRKFHTQPWLFSAVTFPGSRKHIVMLLKKIK